MNVCGVYAGDSESIPSADYPVEFISLDECDNDPVINQIHTDTGFIDTEYLTKVTESPSVDDNLLLSTLDMKSYNVSSLMDSTRLSASYP